MSSPECCSCQKPKPTLVCGLCESPVCKACAQFLEPDHFSFLEKAPKELTLGTYCPSCFDLSVAGPLADYDQAMEKAKEILVYEKSQSKETRLVSRKEKALKVRDIPDHDEAILRLAFLASKAGFNAIIDVEIVSEKVRDGAYQTLKWHASGIPAAVNEARIPKDRSIWQNPN